MKLWKRNAVVAVVVLFVCAAVYLNWSYGQEVDAGAEMDTSGGKLLGEATLVTGSAEDPLMGDETQQTPEKEGDVQSETAQKTGYFSSARLNRQQARDSAMSLLQEAAADEGAVQSVKDEANAAIQTMAEHTLSEAQVENLVTAKGYEDCICFIGDSSASVVVSALEQGLEESDAARIMEIVKEQTGLNASQIKIIEADP